MKFQVFTSLFCLLFCYAPSLSAHGSRGSSVTIDEHHSNLRDRLQDVLGEAYDAPVLGLDDVDE